MSYLVGVPREESRGIMLSNFMLIERRMHAFQRCFKLIFPESGEIFPHKQLAGMPMKPRS